uniref:NADH dehydrogenase [ubiquinone] 1 alpha subcomplex subunit 10, mitochondrial n=1 Tax=Myxine glutinosa TaxID=7769 RepID=UPI00358F0222
MVSLPLLRPVLSAAAARSALFGTICRPQAANLHSSNRANLEYGWLAYLLGERSTKRFNKKSKIITIDGNLKCGKGLLGKNLAQQLGMLYLPEPDVHYWDYKTGDGSLLDPRFNGSCSLEKFHADPKSPDGNSFRLQMWMYHVRIMQYSDALQHLLSTGQGVVLERSPFSDFVFLEAMYKQRYIGKECVAYYTEIKRISIDEFLPPHLVIYIDVPVPELQNRLKQHGKPHEQNISSSYLEDIEQAYKQQFLPKMSEHCELLEYNLKQIEDIEKIEEDIEYLKWDKEPWASQNDTSLHHLRMFVQNKFQVANLLAVPLFIPEVTIGALQTQSDYFDYFNLPGRKFAKGFNDDDKLVWLK